MAKRSRPEKWPKDAIGTRLAQFGSTVVLVRSRADWDAAVSNILQAPLSEIDPNKLSGSPNDSVGMCTYYSRTDRKETMFLIGVFDGKIATLVHELAHVTFDICGYYGIPTKAGEANEFYAYTLDFLFSELNKYLFKVNDATSTA